MIHPKVNLHQGEKCTLHPNAYIGYSENGKGIISLSNNVRIGHNTILRTCGGEILIGDHVVINYNCTFHGMGNIIIGANTLISPNVQIYSQNHGIKKNQSIRNQPQSKETVIIGMDCWIGAGSILLGTITIEHGAVIGAGSVVTKNVPSYEIWAGNPAKKVGERK